MQPHQINLYILAIYCQDRLLINLMQQLSAKRLVTRFHAGRPIKHHNMAHALMSSMGVSHIMLNANAAAKHRGAYCPQSDAKWGSSTLDSCSRHSMGQQVITCDRARSSSSPGLLLPSSALVNAQHQQGHFKEVPE